jgi:Mor family transcriptional regulator
MGKMKNRNEIKELILQERASGKTVASLAEKYYYSYSYVSKLCSVHPELKNKRVFSEQSLAIVAELKAGVAPKELVAKYGITKQRISKIANVQGFSLDDGRIYKNYSRQLAQDFFIGGLSVKALEEKYSFSSATIRGILARYSNLTEDCFIDTSLSRKVSKQRLEILEALKTKSIGEVAKEFNCTGRHVSSIKCREKNYEATIGARRERATLILKKQQAAKQYLLDNGLITKK